MLKDLEKILYELGQNMLQWRKKAIEGHWEGTQLKTQADMDAHSFLLYKLHDLAPDIPVISEEDTNNHTAIRPKEYFLIDPIDGTASFAGGFDGFVTQLAYIKNCQVEIAVVYAPALNELFSAQKNKGATLNQQKLEIKHKKNLSLIDNYPEPKGIAKQIYKAMDCHQYVECGSLGLKICKIADDTANLFVKDVILKDWDVAPADLILKEAGGYFGLMSGNSYYYDGSYYKTSIIAAASKEIFDLAVIACSKIKIQATIS